MAGLFGFAPQGMTNPGSGGVSKAPAPYGPRERRMQSLFSGLTRLGAGLMAGGAPRVGAPAGGAAFAPGLLGFQQELERGRQNEMEMAKLQTAQDFKERQFASQDALRQAQIAEMQVPAAPDLAKDASGFQRYVTGPNAGQRAFPDVPAPTGFEGTGMDAQAYNELISGDPTSPKYAAAWTHLSRPRTTLDQETGKMITIQPDLGRFTPPVGIAPSVAAPSAGQTTRLPGGSATATQFKEPKMSAAEAKVAGFADRMTTSSKLLDTLDTQGTSTKGYLLDWAGDLGNYFQSPEYQQYEQAKRDWTNANLRQESGAVIGEDEMANAEKQYFPMPGDSPKVIAQKRKNRRTAEAAMRRAAGKGYKRPTGGKLPADLSGMNADQLSRFVGRKDLTDDDRERLNAAFDVIIGAGQ